MTTIKSGEVSWTDDSNDSEKKTNSKDIWLRLDAGSNEMRLVTQPFQYLTHKFKKEGDPGFGQKVYCSSIHNDCPLCASGDKPKRRWLLGVISRKTQAYKILDISWAVFSDIQKLAKNTARWGDPTKFDIDVVVDKNGGATGYYTVQPLPKEPLSAADQAIKDNYMDLEDLKRRVTPPTGDKVQARMDKIAGIVGVVAPVVKAAAPAAKTQATESASDSSELDADFPDYSETQAAQ